MVETAPAAKPDAWRDSVRRGMLTVAAIIAPPVVVVSFVLRSGTSSWLDKAVLLATGILLPVLRFTRGSLTTRSMALLVISCCTSIYLLGRIGLVAGLGVSLATFAVLALISANRRVGFAIIGLTAIAYYTVGFLASQHILTITAADWNLGIFNPIVALAIASTKMVIVILFFMHVKYQSNLIKMTVGAGFFTFLVLITMTLSDYISRAWGLW